jgi:hypothetical protein
MITNEYAPPAPTQNQGGTQSSRSSADYSNVV